MEENEIIYVNDEETEVYDSADNETEESTSSGFGKAVGIGAVGVLAGLIICGAVKLIKARKKSKEDKTEEAELLTVESENDTEDDDADYEEDDE